MFDNEVRAQLLDFVSRGEGSSSLPLSLSSSVFHYRAHSLLWTHSAVPSPSELQEPPARFPWPRSCNLQSPLRQGLTESALHTSFISDHRSAQDPCLHPLIAAGHGFMLDQVRLRFIFLQFPRPEPLADFSSFFRFRRKGSGRLLLPSSSRLSMRSWDL